MHRTLARIARVAGVISGMVLAWLLQPWIAPPYTVRATVALAVGADDFFHEAVNKSVHDWIAPVLRDGRNHGPTVMGFTWPAGRKDRLEFHFRCRERETSLAVVKEVVTRMVDANPAVKVIDPPAFDLFQDPSLPVLLFGAAVGWVGSRRFTHREPEPDPFLD